jgi:hypothetical protein
MTGSDDYGHAFKEAKLEHDQRRRDSAEPQRLRAEADADTAALSNVVLPQPKAAAQKLEPLSTYRSSMLRQRNASCLMARTALLPTPCASTACLVLSSCSDALRRELEGRGYTVAKTSVHAFPHSAGSACCLTLRLDHQTKGSRYLQ